MNEQEPKPGEDPVYADAIDEFGRRIHPITGELLPERKKPADIVLEDGTVIREEDQLR